MLKRTFAILIAIIGLTAGFSAYAASGTCPTDNGAGVGCNIGIGEYYCLSACRTGQTQCPSWTGTVCATGLTCPANCASADSCGYCNSCSSGYTLCGSYPSQTCTANTTAPAHCSSYNQCTATCTACAQGYELLAGQCIGATLKLGSDSVGSGGAIYQSSNPALYVLSSGSIGIGTSTPNATLELAPVSGYSILAGNFKIGNVALPTTDADAATKGYVDSVVASATSSISNLWGGTTGGNIWSLNSGNVGIGTSTPAAKFHILTSYNNVFRFNDGASNVTPNISIGGPSVKSMALLSGTGGSVFTFDNSGIFGIYADTKANIDAGTSNGGVAKMVVMSSGNVGIGTTNPQTKNHVWSGEAAAGVQEVSRLEGNWVSAGSGPLLRFTNQHDSGNNPNTGEYNLAGIQGRDFAANWAGGLAFMTPNSGTTGGSALVDRMVIRENGNVGIGTTNPTQKLDVRGNISLGSWGDIGSKFVGQVWSDGTTIENGMTLNSFSDGGGISNSIQFTTNHGGVSSGIRMTIDKDGNVGIGTTDPGSYRLKVAGNAVITGTLQTQTGSDFAEEFNVSEKLPAGTVVVMANNGHKSVKAAKKAYDKTVVGIVSDNPSIIAGRVDSGQKVVVAMMGVVSVNVSNINGEIEKGDLLTTSRISGFAMKADEFKPGTIIGKALENLVGNQGKIKVLVNLQ